MAVAMAENFRGRRGGSGSGKAVAVAVCVVLAVAVRIFAVCALVQPPLGVGYWAWVNPKKEGAIRTFP